MIRMQLTPDEFDKKAAYLEENQGIQLSGNSGTIVKMGVKAAYTFTDNLLTVEIIDKPFFVTTEYCEEQLLKLLR